MPGISFISTSTSKKSRPRYYFGLVSILVVTTGLFLTCIQPGTLLIDGSIFSAVALKDLHGGKLYVDAWENKPPGIFYLIELFLLLVPGKLYAVFMLAFLCFSGIGTCLFSLFYRYSKYSLVVSLLLSSLAMLFTIIGNNIGDGLVTEAYGMLCILSSICAFEKYHEKPSLIFLTLSAIGLGSACWFKEPFIFICIPLFIHYCLKLQNTGSILKFTGLVFIPTAVFILLLALGGSLIQFIDTFTYNLGYVTTEKPVPFIDKLNTFDRNLIHALIPLVVVLLFLLYQNISNAKTRSESLLFLAALLGSACFVFLTPYNFGHYYLPSFVFFFVVVAKQYQLYTDLPERQGIKFAMVLVLIVSIYRADEAFEPRFTFQIRHYVPDRIAERLLGDTGKTLFVDYLEAGRYYLMGNKLYPTYLPLGVTVHFLDNENGKRNRKRIEQELLGNPPDYVITTYTTAYFYWHIDHRGFYENRYEKVDSIKYPGENIIYLLEKRK